MLAYLRLLRISNVFTALADVTMGFLFAQAALKPLGGYLSLAAASALLYTAGMVLNDVWDVDQDRRERPERPIPSGAIPLSQARRVGVGLLLSGVVFGWAAGFVAGAEVVMPWRGGVVATLLAALVVAYDAALKRTIVGPLAMGGCRFLNVLLGMTCATTATADALCCGFSSAQLCAAGGVGVYIAGVTWFARREASESPRWQLACASLVMAGGIGLLAMIYRQLPNEMLQTLRHESTWLLLLGLLAFVILRRCVIAVVEPTPQRVQLAVVNAIWSLIMLDAAVALLVSTAGWSLAIVGLLVPTMLLGRRFQPT